VSYRFKKHYTRDEARALLPQIRKWLEQLTESRVRFTDLDQRLTAMLADGRDIGGDLANQWVRTFADIKQAVLEFQRRDLQIKDLDRGLIDFPSIVGGKEVFLCWEKEEEDIDYWHDLDSNYAGREPL